MNAQAHIQRQQGAPEKAHPPEPALFNGWTPAVEKGPWGAQTDPGLHSYPGMTLAEITKAQSPHVMIWWMFIRKKRLPRFFILGMESWLRRAIPAPQAQQLCCVTDCTVTAQDQWVLRRMPPGPAGSCLALGTRAVIPIGLTPSVSDLADLGSCWR